jgi:hypothetical protein
MEARWSCDDKVDPIVDSLPRAGLERTLEGDAIFNSDGERLDIDGGRRRRAARRGDAVTEIGKRVRLAAGDGEVTRDQELIKGRR